MGDPQGKLPSQLSSVSSMNLNGIEDFSKNSRWTNAFKISDYMVQNCTFPTTITFLFFIFLMYQIYTTSIWHPFLTHKKGRDDIFYYIYIVAFFSEQTDLASANSGNDFTIQFIVFTVLFVISLISLLYAFASFKITRQMNSLVIYFVRLTHEYVGIIIIYPISSLAGQICYKIININEFYDSGANDENSIPGLSILAFVLLLIYLIYFIFVTTFFYGASSASVYIDHSYFMNYDQFYFRIFLLLNAAIIFLQPLFMGIENWGFLSVVVFHLIIVIYEIIQQTYLPFQFAFSNIIFSGILYAMIAQNIFVAIVYMFFIDLERKWLIIVYAAILVVSIIISSIVYSQLKSRKEKKLFYNGKTNTVMGIKVNSDNIRLTDEEKVERFSQMKLESTQNSLFYLHYGLHDMSDMFLDMSLIQYIVQNERTKDNVINCLRFVIIFPTHIRIANQLMYILKKMGGFSLFDQYIIFQVRKIRILRQSSSSLQSTEQLHEISRLNQACQSKVSNFFGRRTANCGILTNIYKSVSNVNGLFKESLVSYANSTLYRDEYVNFLIDGQSDFTAAISETRKREMLETGTSYAKDICFRSFVVSYESYLRDKVLNSKGQFISAIRPDGSISMQTDTKHTSSSGELELRVEEEIGKTIINQARIRIAMQNAIRCKKANFSKVMIFYLILSLILSIILFSVMFGLLFNYFDHRYSSTQRSMKSSYTLMYFVTSNLANLLAWGNQTGNFVFGSNREKQWYTHESPYRGFLDYNLTFSQNALWFQKRAQRMYIDLTSDFSSFALESSDRESVQKMSSPLVNPSVNLTLCYDGSPAKKVTTGLAMAFTFIHVSQASLAKNTDYATWFSQNNDFCHAISINSDIASAMNEFRLGIVDEEKKNAKDVKKFLNLLTIIIPIVYFIYGFILFIIFAMLYMHEVQNFATSILGFEKATLEDAASSLNLRNKARNGEKSDMNQNQEHSSNYLIVLYIVAYFCLMACILVLFIVDSKNAETLNIRFQSTTIWSLRSSVRMPFTLISLQSLLLALFITPGKRSVETNITNAKRELETYRGFVDFVVENSNFLIQGDSETEELIGFDSVIDDIITKTQCEPDPGNVSMHETYRCNSLNQLIYYYDRLSNDIAIEISKYDGYVYGKMPGEIPHLVLNHIIPDSITLNERFDHLVVSFLENFKTSHIIFYIIQLIVIVIIFIVGFLLWKHFNNAYDTALLLLRRVSPVAVVSNTKLLKYILDISSNDKVNVMSTSESIVKNSLSSIICIGKMKTIEIVNKSVSSMLGYTPDQVLGQNIENIFDDESAFIVNQKIDLMMAKQCPLYYESHIMCVNDNNMKVPCMIMMIGIENDENELSFVIVLNEESELIEQQKKAEEAKASSEKLLYNILPRSIVTRINAGEKDISFTVEKATICFIDFVKFSEHSAHLTPKEIMGHLSAFFGAYDEIIMKYEHLMKIKLIGDVYMCAGGLFSPDIQPSVHAEQMIGFALDALTAIDELNVKLSTLLTVRIGINTGGPIIAGVLGTDKPVFDIIGDPINIASRLQSTDIPGQIQISKDTYEIIGSNDFNIEPRGEVFLKGKGNQMVYIVKP
ncbi:hypothetical protein M9Y10_034868 [Tritrichomonas musculus]|uniref:Adenylate and Guanylate cyclase catalytic domain containing protein n=1 Tax=Tritrichomonas musculus TaxID=1915356 RepID=A0ABR2KG39_9EUKA